jgi:hypothetical protein
MKAFWRAATLVVALMMSMGEARPLHWAAVN